MKTEIPAKALALNDRAIRVAKTYTSAESELISIFQELDQTRFYLHFGATSLIGYGIEILKLSEGAAANLVTVARKSVEVPALKAAVESGAITITKARRIAPVITSQNQEKWLELAKLSSSRVIEKEVARENPQLAVPERLKYKTEDRLEISFGISERLSKKLARVKDLLAQSNSKLISSEEALECLVDEFIERNDPIRKAERNSSGRRSKKVETASIESVQGVERGDTKHGTCRVDDWISAGKDGESCKSFVKHKMPSARTALPAVVKHAVTLRDLRQCTHVNVYGKRCSHTKWLDVHHIVPVAKGGSDDVANLTTLCSAHHRMVHQH